MPEEGIRTYKTVVSKTRHENAFGFSLTTYGRRKATEHYASEKYIYKRAAFKVNITGGGWGVV